MIRTTMMIKNLTHRYVLVILLSTLLHPSTVAGAIVLGEQNDADINVGCLFPLTGRGGLYGRDSQIGIQIALEKLAQSPDVYPTLKVVIEDTRSKASRATRIVKDFVEKGRSRFICGVVNSSVAWQVAKVAAQEEVFFIGTDHASSRMTSPLVSPYYFRVNNNTQQSAIAGAKYIKEYFPNSAEKPIRISHIAPDYDYGYTIWQDLVDALDSLGVHYQVVTTLWPRLYEPNYSAFIKALLEKPTDLVINSMWGGDLVAFIQQANNTSLFSHAKFANFDTGGNYEVLVELGKDLPEGLIMSARHHNNWPHTPLNQWFVSRFYELSGRYPSYAAEGAYSGIMAIAEAVHLTGVDASNDALKTALEHLSLRLPEDPEGFSSFMDPKTHQLQQVIAIGTTTGSNSKLSLPRLLSHWKIYYPER
ncbi:MULTISPECIES: ABC transporter substrate-binding protein [Neptunomonas]|uniref:ABC transporter substrate-binding protein n=1 Tax=Neptunomonas phycophila TaxID=1572645 RepID=A0AAW7XHX5_9GAMM|nr:MULTISPECIES: ABC transporter substrate-binding protein [Neptunomonas]MDN2661473.1 ABC transporter substrate-binding protein [Neptunomonas sp. CHC150]MDO6452588.1 ABC transporter substrate-binding protein [Neptunomonas phycophila]MDO6467761.1 ABC transporter substrate-binding protein [Neptunomonas phycophila]